MIQKDTPVLQVGVKVLLGDGKGKYLLLKRSLTKYPDTQGRWDIAGGRILPGTPLLENIKREVDEETGLSLVGEPRLVAAQDILRVPDKHVVRLTYSGVARGTITLDTAEHDEYRWCTGDEIRRFDDVDRYFGELVKSGAFDSYIAWNRHP